jgi:hypothetical protein
MVTDHHHQDKRCLREMRHVMGIVLGGGITILDTLRAWRKNVFVLDFLALGNVSSSELGDSEDTVIIWTAWSRPRTPRFIETHCWQGTILPFVKSR